MPLELVRRMFGEANIPSREPGATHHANSIYSPFSKEIFFDRYAEWGLYGSDGRVIENAAYRRGVNLALIGQSEAYATNTSDCERLDEDVVYFGPLIPHYGHFVVSSLARAWYLQDPDLRRGRRVLCHSDHAPSQHFDTSYMGALVHGLGLRDADFVHLEHPHVIARVTVPEPTFVEQKEALKAFLAPMHRIGSVLLAGRQRGTRKKFAYLSKSQVRRGAVVRVENEFVMESLLQDSGVDIFYPEQLSLIDQLEIFASYETVMGFAGSAFHTHVFIEKPPRLIGLTLDDYINSNLVMMDKLNNVSAVYLYPKDNLEEQAPEGYGVSRSIRDPKALAHDLIDAAGIARPRPSGARSPVTSPQQNKGSPMSPFSYFLDNTGRPIHKSGHYFFAYERHFSKYVGQPCTFLEIGAGNGGSSQMWKKWLGPLARIVTVDINPICRQYGDEQVEVRIGSQSDAGFLNALLEEFGQFDVVLDDGSHHMSDVVTTFNLLYDRIAINGVYLIEDMHTAYWENYGGGKGVKASMIEVFKDHLDKLNADHIRDGSLSPDAFTRHTLAMTAYDSILVFEKTPYQNKIMRIVGDETLRVVY